MAQILIAIFLTLLFCGCGGKDVDIIPSQPLQIQDIPHTPQEQIIKPD